MVASFTVNTTTNTILFKIAFKYSTVIFDVDVNNNWLMPQWTNFFLKKIEKKSFSWITQLLEKNILVYEKEMIRK